MRGTAASAYQIKTDFISDRWFLKEKFIYKKQKRRIIILIVKAKNVVYVVLCLQRLIKLQLKGPYCAIKELVWQDIITRS